VIRTFGPGSGPGALATSDVLAVLEQCAAPPGRLEPVSRAGQALSVFVDYAHTDDALKTVLSTVRAAMGSAGRLWCVFGCGGDRDRTKRPKMGRVAADLADKVVVTSDNPRTESPSSIIDEILAGVPAGARSRVTVDADRERAILRAVREAGEGDAVVIAGKGHEDYQILPDPSAPGGTVTRRFDDREVARRALRERGVAVLEPVVVRAGVDEQETADLET
jgi:UDP-N-acetylmuramoyl-L-alanyl-D-glutamate--2,6-diaminopimelate ligase